MIKTNILDKLKQSHRVMIALSLSVLLFVAGFTRPAIAGAATVEELQARSQSLQAEIDSNNSRIAELNEQANSLQVAVDELSAEIATATAEIELTQIKLEELGRRLKEAEAELARQKELLKATLQAVYERSGVSSFELLMATDSFTTFVNEQEYLGQLQSAVKQSTEKVIALKQQIEEEKRLQEELLKHQKQQRAVVDAKRAQQQELLDSTRGEEGRYREVVAQQQAELQEAEEQLAALLYSGSYVSYGPVSRGQIIGSVGSTGYSTGPHIHFQVYHNGSTLNPQLSGTTLVNGYGWPLLNGVGWISQGYGCVASYWDYSVKCNNGQNSFHSGLDIATSAYTPIVAAADGEVIFKGCRAGLGYVVVVDHGGGWQTWYPHQVTPEGQVYGYCG